MTYHSGATLRLTLSTNLLGVVQKVVETTQTTMGRGRRGTWRSYRFTDEPTTVCFKGQCVLAPVTSVADLIDMCATVAFVNNDSSARRANTKLGALRATDSGDDAPGEWTMEKPGRRDFSHARRCAAQHARYIFW